MPNYTQTRFFAVSETGSRSCDEDEAGDRYEERANCGHAHRTIEAARTCLTEKMRSYCLHGHVAQTPCVACDGYANADSTSALWYGGTIHDQHGHRIDDNYDGGQ